MSSSKVWMFAIALALNPAWRILECPDVYIICLVAVLMAAHAAQCDTPLAIDLSVANVPAPIATTLRLVAGELVPRCHAEAQPIQGDV